MRTIPLRFPGTAGRELAGILDLPDGEPRGYVLFAHCFTCGKSMGVIRHIARQLAAEGLGQLRFDFTGLGQSEGEFAETTFATNTEDLVAAAEFLGREHGAPAVLAGHSLGGTAALATAHLIPSVRCVATVGAPAEPAHLKGLLTGLRFDDRDAVEVSIGGRPFAISRRFVEDLDEHDLAGRIETLGRPVLVFHSPLDSIVGIENAERIFTAARHPRSFVSLGNADHLVSDRADAEFVGHVLAAWAGYYVEEATKRRSDEGG